MTCHESRDRSGNRLWPYCKLRRFALIAAIASAADAAVANLHRARGGILRDHPKGRKLPEALHPRGTTQMC
jgi:hypothetical protein